MRVSTGAGRVYAGSCRYDGSNEIKKPPSPQLGKAVLLAGINALAQLFYGIEGHLGGQYYLHALP